MAEHEAEKQFEWNEIYTGTTSDYQAPDALLLEVIDSLPPGRALDVGCGSGGLLAAMAERGWKVTGLDIAPKGIESARKVLEERGLQAEFVVADASTWQPTGQFDLITNSFALPDNQAGQAALFASLRQALAPGGSVLIKDFDASMKRLKQFAPYHCPTVEELVEAFEGLEILRAEVVNTPSHQDCGHVQAEAPPWTAALLHARRD